nr:ribonuclease H-like domain-containing protein [Tanacetum cinerariifolium]
NTVRGKNVNTARPKEVVNAVKGNNPNAVKASACWVWKPKTKVLDHVSKQNSAPITLKKFHYVDAQGKFNGKADESFFVRYSLNSKAFGVFNSRTRIVEENLHIRFSESIPNVVGSGLDWLFDIDVLTRTMIHEQIVASTQSKGFAGTKESVNAGQARKEAEHVKDYICLESYKIVLTTKDDSNKGFLSMTPSK